MDKKNILLATSIIVIAIVASTIYNLIPNFNTTEFDQESIINISEGSTTTINETSPSTTSLEEINESDEIIIVENKIDELLKFNKADDRIFEFETFLIIGSDERSEDSSEARGFVTGQRSDVIILALIHKEKEEISLISFPRDLLIKNTCTNEIERINASFNKNECGNSAENLSASILNITGLLVDHFALFNFEGFEKIIDSMNGVEVCLDEAQREGYSFELQKGCQIVSGEIALNWVVSRNTEVLVGEKLVDENGNDASVWEPMQGVSDLYRVKKQQEIILSLLERLNEFNSYSDLLNLINALEKTFLIDENLSIPNATQLLWGYRNFNFSNINKLTVPTKPYRTEDGKEVLVLTDTFYNFLVKEDLLSQP
jgi:LCP family protein required for cell wall assembly